MKLTKISPILRHMNAPNVVTTLGLVFGIFAAFFLTQRDLRMAIICLFFAGVMDLVDGYVATKLRQQTDFGKHLDTLVDFFACVIMPIWMVFDLLDNSPIVIAALVFYCICGLWRLANYNLVGAGKVFTGLPVPGAMCIVTMVIWCVVMYGVFTWVAAIMFFIVGGLMVSGIQLPKYGLWQVLFGIAGVAFLILVIFS
ncbi:MAG: CDP-alcohol phosphatidyltransferase family protein [Firmicutes bacterium]|nr:CDP-alcohol phosphatidyltransferase family protein [Bacillota bacterium]